MFLYFTGTIIKPVVGFDGYYVDNTGNVYSDKNTGSVTLAKRSTNTVDGLLRPTPYHYSKSLHQSVSLFRNKIRFRRFVHHLVLEAFVGPRPKGASGLHKMMTHWTTDQKILSGEFTTKTRKMQSGIIGEDFIFTFLSAGYTRRS